MSRTIIDAVDLDEAWIMDALTGAEITYGDREVALTEYGLVVEFNI